MKYKNCLKATVFILLFTLLFSFATQIVTVSASDSEFQWISGIYDEPENTLDAVYIGSSNCYAFWNPNLAWEQYGIAVYPYSCSSLPLLAVEYLIKEARKTQPNAVYVVNINTPGDRAVSSVVKHRLLDFMPLSINKLQLTDYLCDLSGLKFSDRLEYYFPIIRFHDRWIDLTKDNFSTEINSIKGGNTKRWYLSQTNDFSKDYVTTEKFGEISDTISEAVNSLLDYCDREKIKIVFVTVPHTKKEEQVERLNTINKIIQDRGYPTVNLINCPQQANIDPSMDYYNKEHTNIHGSIKFTAYLSQYLIENYGFEDKRGSDLYESWDAACEEYSKIIAPYVLDIEHNAQKRDFSLAAPDKIKAVSTKSGISVTWEKTEGADGYTVYRKTEKGSWKPVGECTAENYLDSGADVKKTYYYAVVAYKTVNGEKFYGNYIYNGVKSHGLS